MHKPAKFTALQLWLLLVCSLTSELALGLDYLYINANEGSASGGHAAIGFDQEIFHFQHVPTGWLRIVREEFPEFRFRYTERENRTIYRHHLELPGPTESRLRESFNRVLLIEDSQYERLEALQADERLLTAWLGQYPDDTQPIQSAEILAKGVGIFFPEGWNPQQTIRTTNPAQTLLELAEDLRKQYGPDFISQTTEQLQQELQQLRPEPLDVKALQLKEDALFSSKPAFSERYTESLQALAALQVLNNALAPEPSKLIHLNPTLAPWDKQTAQTLKVYRAKLKNQLLAMPQSNRSDWGFSLLVGMARLIALDESLVRNQWVVLSLREDERSVALHPDQLDEAATWAKLRWQSAQAGLTQALEEWGYVRLEQAANLIHEIELAKREQRSPNLRAIKFSPIGAASVVASPPEQDKAELLAYLQNRQTYLAEFENQMGALYGYQLVGRNCASEIFRQIDLSLKGEDQNDIQLYPEVGEPVDGAGLALIPFLAFESVRLNWHVKTSEVFPSRRLRLLTQSETQANPYWLQLRESNVVTAQFYRWHSGDSIFLIFSDDLSWLRPIAGGFNLASGLGQTVWGLFAVPFDGGANLHKGAIGFLMSLPELVFFNIRKGSNPELEYLATD